MKLKQLIQNLQALESTHGDVDVLISGGNHVLSIKDVCSRCVGMNAQPITDVAWIKAETIAIGDTGETP